MLTTKNKLSGNYCDMKPVARIHQNKRPVRRHFIKEWMEARGMEPKDLIDGTGIDRSTVYRWLGGQLPRPEHQEVLAAFFSIEPEALLRHPDDDWISRFFAGRSEEEKESIKEMMERAWPKNTGTGQR